MVNGLIQVLLAQLLLRGINPAAHERKFKNGVDLVKRKPVFHFVFVTIKNGRRIALIEPDHLPVHPAVVLFSKM
ncbi:hypothetical protein D3C74_488790 [compost metagenome]